MRPTIIPPALHGAGSTRVGSRLAPWERVPVPGGSHTAVGSVGAPGSVPGVSGSSSRRRPSSFTCRSRK
jgi:hypothetical protein